MWSFITGMPVFSSAAVQRYQQSSSGNIDQIVIFYPQSSNDICLKIELNSCSIEGFPLPDSRQAHPSSNKNKENLYGTPVHRNSNHSGYFN